MSDVTVKAVNGLTFAQAVMSTYLKRSAKGINILLGRPVELVMLFDVVS